MKANYLVAHGHQVHIVTTDQRDAPLAFSLDVRVELHDLGINYELDNERSRTQRLLIARKKKREHQEALEQLLRSIKPDITIATGFQAKDFLYKLRDGSKKILEMHSSKYTPVLMYPKTQPLLRLYGQWRIKQYERLARQYDSFVILTQEELPLWHRAKNVTAIPNPQTFSPEERINVSAQQVIAVGRYEYQKNFSELIDLWASIAPRHPGWQLNIYGDGPYKERLREQIQRLSLSDSCTLHDGTSDIYHRYLEHSIYAMTSHCEGLPMVLLEAQALGLPIVSYALPSGPRDIITDGVDGFLVPVGDRATFAQRLSQLISSVELREQMSIAANQASERYTLERIMPRWTTLFEHLLDNER